MAEDSPTPTSVYRYYDRFGVLIYVGITSRAIRRQREHNDGKAWWPYVVRQDVEHYDTRREAMNRERELIQRYHPPFNRQHNPDSGSLRAAYLAVANVPDPTSEDSGTRLYAACGRLVPFVPLDDDFVDGRLRFRTDPTYAPVVARIRWPNKQLPEPIVHGASAFGVLEEFTLHGPFAVLHFRPKRNMPRADWGVLALKPLDPRCHEFYVKVAFLNQTPNGEPRPGPLKLEGVA